MYADWFVLIFATNMTLDDIQIKPIATLDDLKKSAQTLADAYNAEPCFGDWNDEEALRRLKFSFDSPSFVGMMAISQDMVVGGLAGNIEPDYAIDYFNLRDFFVFPETRRNGIGTMLMDALKAHLKTLEIKEIMALTSKNDFGINFYKENDFGVIVGMRKMTYLSPETAFLFE